MPRPKSYDRSQAVEKVCNAFWRKGYDALGVRALEQETGLNRFAIQTEFGGKEGLFLEALERYTEATETHLLQPLREGDLDQIVAFFRQFGAPSGHPCRAYGCLMVNTVIENIAPGGKKIRQRTDQHFDRLREALRSALSQAMNSGQIAGDFDIEKGVAFLVGATMGLQVMVRQAGAVETARPFVEMLVRTIGSWRVET